MKGAVIFAFFQTSGTSASQHKLSKIIKNDLTMTSVSSPTFCKCILSSLFNLYMSSLFKYSLIWSFSTKCKSSFLQTFPQVSETSLFWGLTQKDPNWRRYWVLGLFHILCQQLSIPASYIYPMISLVFFSSADMSVETPLVSFYKEGLDCLLDSVQMGFGISRTVTAFHDYIPWLHSKTVFLGILTSRFWNANDQILFSQNPELWSNFLSWSSSLRILKLITCSQ